jgi:maltose/moltooligosaccharide transporter
MLISGLMQRQNNIENGFVTIMNDFQFMPKNHEIGLGSILFLRFSLCGYTTLAVTQHIYGTTDTTSEAYNTGANQIEMFANYNLIAAIASFTAFIS